MQGGSDECTRFPLPRVAVDVGQQFVVLGLLRPRGKSLEAGLDSDEQLAERREFVGLGIMHRHSVAPGPPPFLPVTLPAKDWTWILSPRT